MALNNINLGTAANNGTGEDIRSGGGKINANFAFLDSNKTDKGNYAGTAGDLKTYVDTMLQGLKWKDSVLVATTANIALTGEQTIDGVLTATSRVLVKEQTAKTENGIYLTGAGAWIRTTDADANTELTSATVSIEQGTTLAGDIFTCNTSPITLGTTDIEFVSVSRGTVVTDHNALSGKQGGTSGEYNHLTNAELNKVQALPASSEAAFTKNSAFNLPFGTTAGTVAQGDDSRILNGQAAFEALPSKETPAGAQAKADAKVEDLIVDGVLDKAPSQNAVFDALAGKQASLVSGTNIKTINNTSILGSGNLTIAGGGGTTTDVLVTDDLQSVIDTANAGAYIRITPGVHEYGINNNGQTQDAILYIDKSLSIEIMAGATIKLADGTIPLETTPEITTNQGVAKDLDDMTMGATSNFTGIAKIDYYIQIDGTGTPNTFKWGVFNEDGTYTLRTAGVAITGAEQTLEAGVKIKFGATTGHNINSIWYVSYDGKAHYGIRVGTGFHANYIEDVNIFGEGTIDLNITNNVQPSLLVKDIPACVFIHGRVRRCFTKDITMINAHRTFMAYGENNGTYEAGGNVSGGVSFDAEYIDIIKTKNRNTTIDGYGILLGHPLHRGLLKYVRCNENYIKSLNTCLEPNYLLREYEVKDNIIDSATALYPIHLWRRSDNGIVSGNKLMSELSGTRAVVSTGAPGGWDTAKNVTQHNNYNLSAGKVSPYPPFSNSVNNATANMIAYYPLASNSAESLGATSGINGVDTGITYASEAQFNGGTSKILIPDNNIFSFTDGVTDKPFTITFEAKVNDITSSTFINKITNATTGAEWFLWYDTQNLNIQLCDLSTTNYIGSKYTFTPTTATFYKIGITYNGSGLTSGIKIYVNGTSVGSAISAGTYSRMKNTTSEVTLGKTGWTEAHQLNGSIKNLRFYSEEKSQAGIAAINAL